MATFAQSSARHGVPSPHRLRGRHNPLIGPLLLLIAVMAVGAAYVGYVLWPRWPDSALAPNAPALPIVVAGVTFNIEPAAIRTPVQRRPGTQTRVDLAYRWPSLAPADGSGRRDPRKPLDPSTWLFVTVHTADGALPLAERLRSIYPRYLVPEPTEGPPGLTLRAFRDDTPYNGEELVFDSKAPMHFLARCTRQGIMNSGNCLLERRIGDADITFRFPRAWLADWRSVASGIDKLVARLHATQIRPFVSVQGGSQRR